MADQKDTPESAGGSGKKAAREAAAARTAAKAAEAPNAGATEAGPQRAIDPPELDREQLEALRKRLQRKFR